MATAIEPTTTNQDLGNGSGFVETVIPAKLFFQAVRAVTPASTKENARYAFDCLSIFQIEGQWYLGASDGTMLATFHLGAIPSGGEVPTHRNNQVLLNPDDIAYLKKHASNRKSHAIWVRYNLDEVTALSSATIRYQDRAGRIHDYRPTAFDLNCRYPELVSVIQGFWFHDEDPTHVFQTIENAPSTDRNPDFSSVWVRMIGVDLGRAGRGTIRFETVPEKRSTDWELMSFTDEAETLSLLPGFNPSLLARARKGVSEARNKALQLRVRGVNPDRESVNTNPLLVIGFGGSYRVIIMPKVTNN